MFNACVAQALFKGCITDEYRNTRVHQAGNFLDVAFNNNESVGRVF